MDQARLSLLGPLPPARPVIKWAGGKTQLIQQFDPYFPSAFRAYHEPFLGGGAVFFHLSNRGLLRGKPVYLSDGNAELINLYTVIRDRVADLIRDLERHENTSDYYYRLRDLELPDSDQVRRASRTIYLNKTCYNGLYRTNRAGKFNVPYGRYRNPRFLDPPALWAAHYALQGAQLAVEDFAGVQNRAEAGDLVYFDPPYWPISETSSFTGYDFYFGEKRQIDLARCYRELAARGCRVMLSNSAHRGVRELYRDFSLVPVYASRAINSVPERRGPIPEYLVLSWPVTGAPAPEQLPEANHDGTREGEGDIDAAWEQVLDRVLPAQEPPVWPVLLRAADLKAWTGSREPRLLAKFDSSADLPAALAARGLFLLPVSRSEYALLPGQGFCPLTPAAEPEPFFPRAGGDLGTLAFGNSESRYLDYAHHSGMLSHFLGLNQLVLTIRGRSTTPAFTLQAGPHRVQVQGAQFEVDGGFEAPEAIVLVEAKVGLPADFNIRQLYYPYRTWRARLDKPVIPVFLVFEPVTGLFHLWEFRFAEPPDPNSIQAVQAQTYAVPVPPGTAAPALTWEELLDQVQAGPPRWARNPAIPQADDFFKVAALPLLIARGDDDAAKIAASLDFARRQAGYYRDAAAALGLVQSAGDRRYSLTRPGETYAAIAEPAGQAAFLARRLAALPVMHAALRRLVVNGRISREDVEADIRAHSRLTGSTVTRRAKTVMAWLGWLEETFGFVTVERGRAYLRPVQSRIELPAP